MQNEEMPTRFTSRRIITTEQMKCDKSQQILERNREIVFRQLAEVLYKDKDYAIQIIPSTKPLGIILKAEFHIFTRYELAKLMAIKEIEARIDERKSKTVIDVDTLVHYKQYIKGFNAAFDGADIAINNRIADLEHQLLKLKGVK